MTQGATPPARPSTVMRLTPVATVLDRIVEALGPAPARQLPIDHAAGSVLAADVVAPRTLPLFPTALRNGWAVLASDTVGASPYGPAALTTAPVRVAAGDPLPPGTDAVLPLGAVDAGGPIPTASDAAASSENVRATGAEVRAGQTLARRGQRLSAHQAVACVQAGVETVSARRARVAFAPECDPASRAVIAGLLGRAIANGADTEASVVIAPWSPPPTTVDGLICEALGLAPGEATWIAIEKGRAVLRLPPGLGAAAAVALAVIAPLLDSLDGVEGPVPSRSLPLSRKIASRIGWSEIALLGVEGERWTPLTVGDVTITTLARAAAWALIPPDSEGAPVGATLPARPFGDVP
ncbi:molybdopterin-binding protein [Alsobacter metallidurans]|uniref:Molybdopterin molybdenumtransferase n=1 Tax=Alsobacter metallidurans TaxID=340221 RepID=A0A917IA30_9HYPH|nr:hypothetical protein [Alsobacter metallidurans]GGH27191.1 molybdopterin-binding protein [Alsobacter metallidurans]